MTASPHLVTRPSGPLRGTLSVPGDKYGAARRLLRDKIGEHTIQFAGSGLDLGRADARDNV